jgi:integrase
MAWVRKAPSGKWQARWRDPARREHVKTFRLKADAERFLVATEDAIHRGAYHDPNAGRETLGAFWADDRTRRGLSERTAIAYDEIWRLYLIPLAPLPLASITPADVEDVIRGRSRAVDIHKVLRAILGRAVKAGKIATNPAGSVSVPARARTEPRTLSGEELDALVDAMPERYRAFVLVAAYSSLRWSELVALRADRCDLVRDVIRVEEKITEAGHLIHGAPRRNAHGERSRCPTGSRSNSPSTCAATRPVRAGSYSPLRRAG